MSFSFNSASSTASSLIISSCRGVSLSRMGMIFWISSDTFTPPPFKKSTWGNVQIITDLEKHLHGRKRFFVFDTVDVAGILVQCKTHLTS